MPPALIAALPIIIGGIGTGVTAYEAFKGSPSAPKPPDTSAQDALAKTQASTQEKEAIARQAPDLQTQLGGAVAPDYYADLAAKNAGYAGDTNQARDALSGIFGGEGGPSVTGPQGTAPGSKGGKSIFEDLISQNFGEGEEKGASGGFTGV
jgi:hypothetical protein